LVPKCLMLAPSTDVSKTPFSAPAAAALVCALDWLVEEAPDGMAGGAAVPAAVVELRVGESGLVCRATGGTEPLPWGEAVTCKTRLPLKCPIAAVWPAVLLVAAASGEAAAAEPKDEPCARQSRTEKPARSMTISPLPEPLSSIDRLLTAVANRPSWFGASTEELHAAPARTAGTTRTGWLVWFMGGGSCQA